MDIDQRAPITASRSVDITASPLEVWAVLTDIGRWPTWNSDVTEARLDGELASGGTFAWRSEQGTLHSVFRSVETGRELGWTATSRGARGTWVWRIEPTQRGSRVTVEESWSGWSTHFWHKRLERSLLGRLVQGLHNLKTEAEFRTRRDLRLAA
jgi:uncharacterized protein YndB with AHSA1/START domain